MTSTLETDIAWLAGIVDGEGCFTLKRPIVRLSGARKGSNTSYQCWLVLCNTSKAMMDRVVRIYADLGVEHPKMRKVWKGSKATRWQYWIHVQKKHELLKITEILRPYLVAKRLEAEVVAWFLRRACQEKAYHPTHLDIAMLETLSPLKKAGGEAPVEVADLLREVIPSQAELGIYYSQKSKKGSEGVETRAVSSTDNPPHECPTPQMH